MFFTRDNVIGICGEAAEMFGKYGGNYDKLKMALELRDTGVIWCKEWVEPFNSDYISEIDDGTMPVRKILKGVPKKKTAARSIIIRAGSRCIRSRYIRPIGERGKSLFARNFMFTPRADG